MRVLALIVAVLFVPPPGSTAAGAPDDVGDPPRTYAHFLNAREAALCRASAATGGIESFFLNPACVADVKAVSGQATLRFLSTTREGLSDAANDLEASDGAFLFPQVVAVKRSGTWVFGFGYSAPSYRNLEITGTMDVGAGPEPYEGTFKGALRCFETIVATRIGKGGRAGVGASFGIVTLSESVREVLGEELGTAEVTGSSSSVAAGFVYNATERVTLGAGYRWSASIDVEGDCYDQQGLSGTSEIQPTTVAGVTVRPSEQLALHASYVTEGWDAAESTLSAYIEDAGRRNEFGEAVSRVAVGAEAALMRGRLVLRAGGSTRVSPESMDGGAPEWAAGFGGTYAFQGYSVDAALVRERYELDGQGGKIADYGGYLSVSYRF